MPKPTLIALLCLLPAAACVSPPDAQPAAAQFADTDGDGLPDRRADDQPFVDADGDGLPDRAATSAPGN